MFREIVMDRILVSACLLGRAVRYDGRARTLASGWLDRWRAEGRLVPLCPEIAAGLPVPRPPAEIEDGARAADVLSGQARIVTEAGADVSAAFRDGAAQAVALARSRNCRFALLTDGSPSCGTTRVHAGRFDGTTRAGRGVVAEALIAAGIAVFSDADIAALAAALDRPR